MSLLKHLFLEWQKNTSGWTLIQNFGFLKKVACIGLNTWEAGDYSEQKYMVLNGAWNSNWDEVEEARKGLGEVIDNLLCSAFDWKMKIIHYSEICLLSILSYLYKCKILTDKSKLRFCYKGGSDRVWK